LGNERDYNLSDKPEKICPYCSRPIRGKNISILEVNFALHLRKHELRGDPLNLSLPRRVAAALGSSSFNAILAVVGYFVGGWAVANLYKFFTFPTVYVGFAFTMCTITVFVRFRAKQYLRTYIRACRTAGSSIISIVVGTLVANLVILIQGLFPYYQNPYVLALWGLYFMLIADMLYMQRLLGRTSNMAMAVSGRL
jgi:hypothetical protein